MSEASSNEGFAIFSHATLSVPARTWYKIIGPLTPTTEPIIILHGGPGSSHIYMTDLVLLHHEHNQTVIFYDQIGCGRSTHLRERRLDSSFWKPELFIAELNNLITHLQITTFSLLGHSWGGMFAAEYAIARNTHDVSQGLKRLIISNSPSSMKLWVDACNEWRALLPEGLNDTITRHEESADFTKPEYLSAVTEFYKRHLCRRPNPNGTDPFPDNLMAMMASVEDDDTVYFTMNGPSEFTVIGNLKDWSVIGRLGGIKMPTLVISGEFDEARPVCVQPYRDEIQGAEWKILEGTSHCGFVEQPEVYCKLVGEWLARHNTTTSTDP